MNYKNSFGLNVKFWRIRYQVAVLGTLAKQLQNVTVATPCLSARPPDRMETYGSHRTGFRKISFLEFSPKFVSSLRFVYNGTEITDTSHKDVRTFMVSRHDWPKLQTDCFLCDVQAEAEEKVNDQNSRVRSISHHFRDDFKCVG